MVSLISFCSYFFDMESDKKGHFLAPLLPSAVSAVAMHRVHVLHWFSKKHTHLSKNKSPFLNAFSFILLAFSLVNAAQMEQLLWNSFLDLSLSTKPWLYVQSFPNCHDDFLIPFFGFFSPSFHISTLPFQLLCSHSSQFLAHLMAYIFTIIFSYIPSDTVD